jgi:hypothetical protein
MSGHVARRAAAFGSALALAAGCSSTPSPAPAPAPEPPIARSRALALAKAGTLVAADLPGWKPAKPAPATAADRAAERDFWTCMGRPPRTYAATQGTEFTKGRVTLTTSVDVAPTLRRADDDMADWRNPAHVGCLEQQVAATAGLPRGVTVSVTGKPVPVRVAGAEGTFGYVISITARLGARTATLTVVELGARVGHAEVRITAGGTEVGVAPPPTATLVALLARAVARVRKA